MSWVLSLNPLSHFGTIWWPLWITWGQIVTWTSVYFLSTDIDMQSSWKFDFVSGHRMGVIDIRLLQKLWMPMIKVSLFLKCPWLLMDGWHLSDLREQNWQPTIHRNSYIHYISRLAMSKALHLTMVLVSMAVVLESCQLGAKNCWSTQKLPGQK